MRTRWPRPVRLFGTNDRLARPGHEAVHGGRPRNQVSKELRQPQDQSSSPAAYIEVSSDRRERPSNHEGGLTYARGRPNFSQEPKNLIVTPARPRD